LISERFQPAGFNVGFNETSSAGQTVFHFRLHIIPSYEGDASDPLGGVHHAIPRKTDDHAVGDILLGPPFSKSS
jgi:diadenosine tetraphosphate (Ap4A) HIT family hydrolase